MEYQSILFDHSAEPKTRSRCGNAKFFHDVHMDTIIKSILAGKEEYDLEWVFYYKLPHIAAIHYRLDIMKDIDDCELLEYFSEFSHAMKKARKYVGNSERSKDNHQKQKWLLDAAISYCNAIINLHRSMDSADLKSKGMQDFFKWISHFVNSSYFITLWKKTSELQKAFAAIHYSIILSEDNIAIYLQDDEMDYCQSLSKTFQQEHDETEDYSIRLFAGLQFSEIERDILTIIRKQHPTPFLKLKEFYGNYLTFMNEAILTFEQEIQFYIACLEYFQSFKDIGLDYCYPVISESKDVHIVSGYDLSLAASHLQSGTRIICNDFSVNENEKICVLTGPNQGGKTTFVRSLGQIFYLSAIGCPVPCKDADLYFFDQLFTHFGSEEQFGTNTGQLQDELLRLSTILKQATGESVILFNELFSTTATSDGYDMGRKLLQRLLHQGTLCLYVTHLFELANAFENTVSLVSTVDPEAASKRTYRIRRRPADGLVYAASIVEKYDLTPSRIKERILR
ncbi:DNA mismatch repair protein MutS [Bacillus sp. J14TS2]|uniref:MutS-related protein n=1 Tax=Bacillus sp. J14TS2 TaxID=2807188 RepID=UPI001B0D2700|nr:hypothetical protein [Bacillus sp. J14TS2]GIN74805.1 DNA mismatch repair protein MutS [Bacillus sp. J14TS2]